MRSSFLLCALMLTFFGGTEARGTGICPDDPTGHPCLRGAATETYQADSNQCAPNVVSQFDSLKDHGEIMGFWDGGAKVSYPSLDADFEHWQGVQRLAFPADRRILMVLASSHFSGGHYALVSLGTRGTGGFTGRRFGGNRMTDTTQDWNVPPHRNDTIVQNGLTNAPSVYNHPGGIQTLGQYVAIPLEIIGGGGPPGRTQLFDAGVAIDFDVTHCADATAGCIQSLWVFEHSQSGNGMVALAKLDDGRHLMINTLATGTSVIEINVSGLGKPISDPAVFGNWNSPGFGGQSSAVFDMTTLPGWKNYQSLQLVTECGTGHLYLIGIEKNGDSEDWADLYRLNLQEVEPGQVNTEGEPVIDENDIATTFLRVRSKHFWCRYEGSPRQCDFDAASGIYIDPFGTLILYATVHDDSGPKSGVTRFVEFSPNDPVDNPNTTEVERCDKKSKMWIELSNKRLSSGLPPIGAERFFIEYQNDARSQISFETAYSFNNEALSIRYCLPGGFRYKLCPDKSFGGMCQFFCGDSAAECVGPISGGRIRGVSFVTATASSGCFTRSTSPDCL